MNTISSLETTDLPAAYHIEQRAHAFPWSEKTFASNQGERYLNFQLTQNGKMAAFAITQVVLDEATLFNIAVDPDYQRQGLGRVLLEHLIDETGKTRRGDTMAGSPCLKCCRHCPVRKFRL